MTRWRRVGGPPTSLGLGALLILWVFLGLPWFVAGWWLRELFGTSLP